MKCEVCGYEHSKAAFITLHIKRAHNMDSKSYYTDYILKGEAPKCFCGKECKFDDIVHGYRKYCSLYCANTSNEKRVSVSKSRKDNWKESSEKYHNTCLKKYGKMSFVQTEEFKSRSRDSKRTNHNDENYNNRDLAKKTFLSKYGVDNYNKTEYAKEKNRDRMYNSDNRFGSDSFKKRMKCILPVQMTRKDAQTILLSTPQKKETTFYKLYEAAVNEKNSLVPHRVKWNCRPEHTKEWLEIMKKNFTKDQFRCEVLGEFV